LFVEKVLKRRKKAAAATEALQKQTQPSSMRAPATSHLIVK
jgi:hypothetical protein